MTTQLIPKRRFKGFKGSWKLVQVNEVAEFNPSSILPKKFYYVDLESVEEMKLKKVSKEKLETAPSRAQRVARKGDIFYQTVRPYQRNNYLFNLSKRTYVFSTGYAQLRPSIDSSYLINQLITPRFSREVLNRCTGTGYPAISPYNLSTIAIKIPQDKRESQKIGEFFKLLDARIANQKRKIEKIKAIKQAYLTEMFPQEDENVPKRRFKGFEEEWQLKILRELGKTFNGLSGKTKKDFGHGDASFVTYLNVFNNPLARKDGREKVVYDSKQVTLQKGDILFTTSSEVPEEVGMSSVWLYDEPNVYLNSFCFGVRLSGVIDYYFLAFLMRSSYFRQQMIPLAQGISRYNISKSRVMNISIKLPTIKEQQKIGEFFKALDEKIESEEKKLEKLKKMKEAFLEEMFV